MSNLSLIFHQESSEVGFANLEKPSELSDTEIGQLWKIRVKVDCCQHCPALIVCGNRPAVLPVSQSGQLGKLPEEPRWRRSCHSLAAKTPASRKTQIIFEDKCFLQSTHGRVLSYNSLSYLWKNLPERFLVSHSAILLVPDEERMVLCLRAGCCPPPPIPPPPPPPPKNLLFLPAALFCSKNHSATALETWPDRVPIFLSRKSDPLLA